MIMLNLGQSVALDGLIDKYEKTLGSDTAIKCYSDFDTDLKQIQDTYVISLYILSNVTFDDFKRNF